MIVGVLAVLGNVAHAEHRLAGAVDDVEPKARVERYLTAQEITAVVAPHSNDIQRCYRDQAGELARSSKLDVTLSIGRTGKVLSLRSAVNGKPTDKKVDACIREAVEAVQFPARRNDTMAVVPFWFHKTQAPKAGPQLSCWSATGC